MEAEYILCREHGWNKASDKVEKLVLSRAIEIVENERILHEAARTKCERSIALGDCYTIALAENLKGTAVFARPEEDLQKEMERKPFPVKIVFLEASERLPGGVKAKRKWGRETFPDAGEATFDE